MSVLATDLSEWHAATTNRFFVSGVFEASAKCFPALSGVNQFQMRDAVLFAAALALLLDA